MCNVSSSYLYNLQVYLGKEGESSEQQQGARVVRDLATPMYGSGRNITIDNFFTSHALAKFLLGQNLTLLGTCLSECFRCVRHDEAMIDYRLQSANISHMPTVSNAMLAISVEPVTSTYAQTGSKKRGRCQTCARSQEQTVEHRCTESQQLVWQALKENHRLRDHISLAFVVNHHLLCGLQEGVRKRRSTLSPMISSG